MGSKASLRFNLGGVFIGNPPNLAYAEGSVHEVKTYVARHTCSTQNRNKLVTAGFLAKYCYRRLKAAQTLTSREMKEFVKEDLRVEVSIGQCERGNRLNGLLFDEKMELDALGSRYSL
ncbi:hypothetical protein CRG98_001250 [Punica granatum]|uniref:Uncharacterized protein n=1 Tax=Punica granatum TaxID=22663 RepID=A0A2I0LCA3_PUNGR|nr:hypothetical protein CRG98_001250 [Punica granatum]